MGNNWGDGISSIENKNYDYLVKKKEGIYVANSVGVDECIKKSKSQKSGKYSDVILLRLKEYNDRFRVVASEEGKKHHSLARELIISGLKRLEKKHKKEKFILKQYDV